MESMTINIYEPVFSPELEALIENHGEEFPINSLKRFLSSHANSDMAEELLDDEEWELLEIAICAIFIEKKETELLEGLLSAFGVYLYNNYEQNRQLQIILTAAFYYASKRQQATSLKILDKLEYQFDSMDDFEIAMFYRKVKDTLDQDLHIKTLQKEMLKSSAFADMNTDYPQFSEQLLLTA